MNATPDMLTAGLKMIASLGLVLAMILGLLYVLRKMNRQRFGGPGGSQIQVLESHYMGVKKTISLVSVPGKVLVVGIAGDRINLLDTLDEGIVLQQITTAEKKPFGPMLANRLKHFGRGFKGEDQG